MTPRRAAANAAAVAAVAVVVVLQVVAVHAEPLARVLHAVPLTAVDWATVTAAALVPAVVGKGVKLSRAAAVKNPARTPEAS